MFFKVARAPKNKYVVFTVVVGCYDEVLQPVVIDDRFDYILFTDHISSDLIGVWKVRTFDYHNDDNTRESRYPKMHPEELLPEYEASLYIDANICIANKVVYDKVVSFNEQGKDWAGLSFQHPYDCVYAHAYYVMIRGFDKEKIVFDLCHFLRKEGYPRRNGLHENNVIYRKNNKICHVIDESWWELYCRYSRRDQLSLDYVLWKHPEVKLELFLPKGQRACNSDFFLFRSHNTGRDNVPPYRFVKQNAFEFIKNKIRAHIPRKRDRFEDFHYWLYGRSPSVSRIILLFWCIIYTPEYLLGVFKRRWINKYKQSRQCE